MSNDENCESLSGRRGQDADGDQETQVTSTPSSSKRIEGAVCRETHSRTLSEQERRVGHQAQYFLEYFITDRARRDRLPTQRLESIEKAISSSETSQYYSSTGNAQDQSLQEVSLALRDIGDQLSHDHDLNRLIDMAMKKSTRDIFMKVCRQMFADGLFNWGRVVAVFYFAYRLATKAISSTLDTGVPWIKRVISWAMEFIYEYLIWWIVQRGGWRMIKEYFGPSRNQMAGLVAVAVLTVFFAWWKQQ